MNRYVICGKACIIIYGQAPALTSRNAVDRNDPIFKKWALNKSPW